MNQTSDHNDHSGLTAEVDEDYLQQAEQEACQLLYHQRQQFNLRWQNNPVVKRTKAVARWLALVLSVVGFVLCLALLIGGHSWDGASWPWLVCLLVFLAIGVLAYRLPDFEPALERWTDQVSYKSCRKVARRCVKGAHQLTPFTARYELKEGDITYHRDQEEPGQAVWTRTLAGHALLADHITILVKKQRSLHPLVVILLSPTPDWLGCLGDHNISQTWSDHG